MSIYVFLGPSLSAARAQELLKAELLPPVQQGDVLRLLAARPTAIGIVDGYFEVIPSVWHKEIMLAMAEGVHVFGASSMGALRAAELHQFGMVGVGKVFEWYRDGTLTGDDEVAVAHASEEFGYRRVSDALVDIRDACEEAVALGVLPSALAERLVLISQSTYFAERSYEAAARQAAATGEDEERLRLWLDFVRRRGPGLKERDAAALLCRMRDFLETQPGPLRASFTLERTEFLERFRNEVELSRVTRLDYPPANEHEALRGGETVAELRGKQLLRILARREAERLGWQLTEEEVQEKAELFRGRHGLLAAESMSRWMETEGLSETAFWEFINDACLIDRLRRLYGHAIERGLADQLRVATASLHAAREDDEVAVPSAASAQ
jgi:hypothetical protein